MKNKSYDKKVFRLLYILQKLDGGGFYRTSDLAQFFNVTRRTVQRDLELIGEVGFPWVYENDGYKFMEGFSLQKITVTPAERFLLNNFFNLFSKAGAPLDGIAGRFLKKLLATPKAGAGGNIDSHRRAVIKREVDGLAKSIEAKLEDLKFPTSFKNRADEFLEAIETRIQVLKQGSGVDIKFARTGIYSQRDPVATISVPKGYFRDKFRHLDFSGSEKNHLFKIRFLLPNRFFKSLRAVLSLDLYFKFWGPHLKAKSITGFDQFAKHLGFSPAGKEFHYEASYASKTKNVEVLVTRASISWQEVIPMDVAEIKPLLKKTGGIWFVSDFSKGGKVFSKKQSSRRSYE